MSYPQYSFQHSVLIIDDFGKSEKMIRSGLLSYPVQFEFCPGDYDLALEKLKNTSPDLLIVSLEFQNGSVLEFAEKARKHFTNIPSIYLTEPHLLDIQKSIQRMGAFDIIQRPATEPVDLIRRMDRAVRVTRRLKTRAESFIELHEESRNKGILVAELLDEKNEFPLA